ncbi:hypothetical protein [Aurantimonas sp. VKM B-3413]|nr:hypothetical protein [Aurantimonas sp. VKM B-3413]MCB8836589.1 hypothetical protein [Aurantimonas sp. VKM B-3413]
MAKGQMRGNRETRKPKADKKVVAAAAAPTNVFAKGNAPAGGNPPKKKG